MSESHRRLALAQRAGTLIFILVLVAGVWASVRFIDRVHRERGLVVDERAEEMR